MASLLFKWCLPLLMAFALQGSDHHFLSGAGIIKNNHPFYITVTELNENVKENSLEISSKMFTDDLESTLAATSRIPVDLAKPKDPQLLGKLVAGYMLRHLQVSVNGKQVALKFIGYEKDKESVWCYLQANNVNEVQRLDILNDLLYEKYETQMGIIHAHVHGVRKSTRLSNPEKNAHLQF